MKTMKKISLIFAAAAVAAAMTGCIQEINPQNSTVTSEQAAAAPGAFDNFVSAITSTLAGQFVYGGTGNKYPYDYGYSSFYLQRDVMGQDIVLDSDSNWYQTWYTCGTGLGPRYAVCQMPWTYYYGWINSCNTVIGMTGDDPEDAKQRVGAGIAYAMRAMYYMDLARMFAPKTYGLDRNAETVPIITEDVTVDLTHNPRATNADMWAFIVSDLDKAEVLLADYKRTDVYTPDRSVVYGLKARAYLVMEDWANAEKYAKLAQSGYAVMGEAAYTSRETGFNSPNSSWMMGLTFRPDDPNILINDADSSWGSIMCLEVNPYVSGCGYASNYGYPLAIDRHLFETIPATDFRKKCFVDFALEDLSKAEAIEALSAYSDYPEWVYMSGMDGHSERIGGLSLKFRLAGGAEGHDNQYVGFVMAVPMMRVEEMFLIEADAAGMQSEDRGRQLLTAFALTRDPNYVYGQHTDAYGNGSTPTIQNECWWQRRVEFWGEGLATFDIKRLNKGIIRSYPGTNHVENYRWNTTTPPDWMNLCIVETETKYNYDCTNNPTPIRPGEDSAEHIW